MVVQNDFKMIEPCSKKVFKFQVAFLGEISAPHLTDVQVLIFCANKFSLFLAIPQRSTLGITLEYIKNAGRFTLKRDQPSRHNSSDELFVQV